jgi:hypothetical protein
MLKLKKQVPALLIVIVLSVPAFAWDCTNHIVIMNIARRNLKRSALSRVEELSKSLTLTKLRYDGLTIACFLDDARGHPYYDFTRKWHFIEKPFRADKPDEIIAQDQVQDEDEYWKDLLSALQSIIQEMKKRRDGTADKKSKVTDSELLAYLTHLVGDGHNPLHCATRISDEHPKGDSGGNRFKLSDPKTNLHAYWDRAGGLFEKSDFKRDLRSELSNRLSKDDKVQIDAYTNEVISKFAANSPEAQNLDPAVWIKESFDLARTQVYVGIKEEGKVDEEYKAKVIAICSARMALAGYRLAALLNQLYG